MEEFVPGEFQKYVNNHETCYAPVMEDLHEVYAKVECLVHFSYTFSEGKMMLVDLQGLMFKLYDPEIANLHQIQTNHIFVLDPFSHKH